MTDFAWRPTGRYPENSRIAQFMRQHAIVSWQELLRRSVEDIDWFWNAALAHLGVEWFHPYSLLYDDSAGMPWTRWFLGGALNITHNCIDRHIRDGKAGRTALFFDEDGGASRRMTYGELSNSVNRLASALRRAGVVAGERIAMCMPISPEAVAVMFAGFKIGAVVMQPPARLAPAQIAEYITEAKPKVLFMNDGYPRTGRAFSLERTYEAAARHTENLRIVVLERLMNGLAQQKRCISWNDFLRSGESPSDEPAEELDAEHPALILYSSGTTGKSKAVIHTHGGALAQTAKEVGYAFDCHEDDVFCWFTNIGWMMAPWELIGALFFGASVVLYEGTHLYPTPHRMFELIEKYGITIFGFTPTAMRELARAGSDFSSHNRSSLRILGSTGSPLDAETWQWFFKTFGEERCPIMNISGGTELIGCLVSPLPVIPLKPGTVGSHGLGMAVEVCDDAGRPVRGGVGQLVCRKPFPSMTRGLLNDSQQYLQTYFPRGPSHWVHGDRALIDDDGCWFLMGRTDDLIVTGGVKIDPAVLEAMLCAFPGPPRVKEAVAVGVADATRGERIIAFVVLDVEHSGDRSALEKAIQWHVRNTLDPLAQPSEIYVVKALPVNLAAKIPRKLLRAVYEGTEPATAPSLANPQALEELRNALRR